MFLDEARLAASVAHGNIRTGRERQLTDLDHGFTIADFDISADGRGIIFDRARDQSDIVLIDLASH